MNVATEQLSEAVGAVHVTAAWHDPFAAITIGAGHPLMTGFVLSLTVTLNVQVEILPDPSVAVYVTGVVPKGKVLPGA